MGREDDLRRLEWGQPAPKDIMDDFMDLWMAGEEDAE